MDIPDISAISSPSIWTPLAAVALARLSLTTALALLATGTLSLTVRWAMQSPRQSIPSPRDTLLHKLSPKQAAALPYPPDILPGGRDVATPYGVMRVYEWGPRDGEKMLFIHGDTTPAPMLGPVAHKLVDKGCRVMMFVFMEDLWGRGYSDTPLGIPHDARLYGMQIFFAAASSPLSWIGAESGGFSVVAFSLGGGIVMAFAAHFPYLINSIILLAPVGIIRRLPDEYKAINYLYPFLLPFFYRRNLVGKTLGLKVSHPFNGRSGHCDQSEMGLEIDKDLQVVRKEGLDIPRIAQWQFDNHEGFIHSFLSTLRYGPIMRQHSDWREVCSVIKGDTAQTALSNHSFRLSNSKILVMFGEADSVVRANEVTADLRDMIGDHVEFKIVPGDHGFPVSSCDQVSSYISDFCGLGGRE